MTGMIMLIVVNHLTRMKAGYFCVAGINKSTNTHVRPVLKYGSLSTELLACSESLYNIASLVDLGKVKHIGQNPEIEDHIFYPVNACLVRNMGQKEFWELINNVSKENLTEIFGPELEQHGKHCVVKCGKGEASLGCISKFTDLNLYINKYDKLRIRCSDGTFSADLSVTDLRLCESDHITPKSNKVKEVAKRIKSGEKVVLSVGLTRPWQKQDDEEPFHWLQVNNIHLENKPAWRLE